MNNIKVFYWDGMPNFGDALNPIICEKLFNKKIEMATAQKCDAVFIGSLLDDFLSNKIIVKKEPQILKIWGTGFITDINLYRKRPFWLQEKYFRDVEIYAIRGKLSKNRLEKMFSKEFNHCVLGDPGLLAPLLIDNIPKEKKYSVGIIPHHLELHGFEAREKFAPEIDGVIPNEMKLKVPIYKQIKNKFENSIIIDMEANPIDIIKRISECQTIISSALHGLIVSDALGIPNIWSSASNLLIGKDYKFRDYYSIYNLTQEPKPIILNKINNIPTNLQNYIINNYKIPYNKCLETQQNLINCFPYKENNQDEN